VVEYAGHKKAKERLAQILQTAGFTNIQLESKQIKIMLEFLGPRTYIADIEAEKEGKQYIFEIDGKRGHSTRWNKSKDNARDRAMSAIGKQTVRLSTGWLYGERRLPDMVILDEISYQSAKYK
jgi:hypothetical protein